MKLFGAICAYISIALDFPSFSLEGGGGFPHIIHKHKKFYLSTKFTKNCYAVFFS